VWVSDLIELNEETYLSLFNSLPPSLPTYLPTSPLVFSRLGAMESISSIKIMAGAFFSASSKALRRLDSDSPAI